MVNVPYNGVEGSSNIYLLEEERELWMCVCVKRGKEIMKECFFLSHTHTHSLSLPLSSLVLLQISCRCVICSYFNGRIVKPHNRV